MTTWRPVDEWLATTPDPPQPTAPGDYRYRGKKRDRIDLETANRIARQIRDEWHPHADCGTRRGWDRHRKLRQAPCELCAAWRERFLARTP